MAGENHEESPLALGRDLNSLGHDGFFHTVPFTSMNGSAMLDSTSSNTVSPQDLFATTPSAPNSNSFTNLTTPSMYDGSPDDGFLASPLVDDNDNGNGSWPSLFADEGELYSAVQQSNHDLTSSHESLGNPSAVDMNRTGSGSSNGEHRMSLSSGIVKNKRTGRTLGPIDLDHHDPKALKRAKNTLAARKSRQKRRDEVETLQAQLSAALAERDKWMHKAIARGEPPPDIEASKRS